jgi:hypothetical protein
MPALRYGHIPDLLERTFAPKGDCSTVLLVVVSGQLLGTGQVDQLMGTRSPAILDQRPEWLTIDLEDAAFVDCSGLREIAGALRTSPDGFKWSSGILSGSSAHG